MGPPRGRLCVGPERTHRPAYQAPRKQAQAETAAPEVAAIYPTANEESSREESSHSASADALPKADAVENGRSSEEADYVQQITPQIPATTVFKAEGGGKLTASAGAYLRLRLAISPAATVAPAAVKSEPKIPGPKIPKTGASSKMAARTE